MDDQTAQRSDLEHDLANARQEKRALQGLLSKAADEIEHVVGAECDDQAKSHALATASRLRRAASL